MNRNSESKPPVDPAFLHLMESHRQGDFVSDISAAIRQVTAAVGLTGKAGKVVLTLNLKPATNGAAVVFEPVVKTVVPETKPAGSIFYVDDDFNLVREDPAQKKLDLKEVEPGKPASGLREVDSQ